MITVTRMGEDGALVTGGPELFELPGPRWIDVEAPTEEELLRLAKPLKLHRLAIEDSLHLDQRPKLEEYPEHLFVVLQAFTTGPDVCALTVHEMHFFLAGDFLLTVHELPSAAVIAARARMAADPQASFGRGTDFVMYTVADALVDSNFPVLDAFDEEVDALEAEVFERPAKQHVERLFQLKRSLATLRRVLSPQRDVVGLLSRRGVPHVQDRSTLYFRDVYDHLIRMYEQLEALRDLTSSVLDGYLSTVANKTNEITKQLTIFATIFLPLSFVVGFFGQNFDVLSRPFWFWTMLATMVLVPASLFYWFRRLRWI